MIELAYQDPAYIIHSKEHIKERNILFSLLDCKICFRNNQGKYIVITCLPFSLQERFADPLVELSRSHPRFLQEKKNEFKKLLMNYKKKKSSEIQKAKGAEEGFEINPENYNFYTCNAFMIDKLIDVTVYNKGFTIQDTYKMKKLRAYG